MKVKPTELVALKKFILKLLSFFMIHSSLLWFSYEIRPRCGHGVEFISKHIKELPNLLIFKFFVYLVLTFSLKIKKPKY